MCEATADFFTHSRQLKVIYTTTVKNVCKAQVFIGRIPHDCFEDTLVPLFRQAGELFEFRLMINFSGWNRRGMPSRCTLLMPKRAMLFAWFNNLHDKTILAIRRLSIINNCRIFISRIPPTTPSAEIVRLLYALTDEVQEVGRWTPERGVELTRAPEEPATTSPPPAAPSYTLEPWSQARRLRMIHEAQRSAAAAAEWSNRINNGMESLVSSMTSLGFGGGLGLAGREAGVWAPPGAPAAPRLPPPQPRDFNPWTARHPLQEFITPGKDSQ
uniref:RRM domain-containing protein n=1 Tax=Heliothis virescens TaxID=7102 RepID=A0A2A4K588_HELVI